MPSLYFPLVAFGVSTTGASATGAGVSTTGAGVSTLAGVSGALTSVLASSVLGAEAVEVCVVVVVPVSAFFPQETKEKRARATRRAIRIFFILYLPFLNKTNCSGDTHLY